MKEETVDIFDGWLSSRMRIMHTCIPGRIESYTGHTTRKAKVKINIQFRTIAGTFLDVPPINDVPVIFPGSGKFQLLFPLNKGDGVLIMFSEEGIGKFLKGAQDVPSDNMSRFSLTDAIAIPGLWPFTGVPANPDNIIEVDSSGKLVLDKGTKGAARVDDPIQITLSGVDIQALAVALLTTTGFTPASAPIPATIPVTLTGGKITSGSLKVKVG